MKSNAKTSLIHLSLFLVTFVTTTLAGAEWTSGKSVLVPGYTWQDFLTGLPYSICFLTILTAHEFGHYFTALYYRVRVSLPYYIPLPPLPLMFGTLGAFIRLRDRVHTTKENFDIGIAGPLAGFVVSIGFLWYGFTHLPPPEYIFTIHPEYEQFGLDYARFVYQPEYLALRGGADAFVGKNLLFVFFERFVADPARMPNVHELMHYPFLFAGFLSLVFTSINLLPIGQLDGGHVLYGLAGYKWHRRIASAVFICFLFYAGLGIVNPEQSFDTLLWKIPLAVAAFYISMQGLGLSKRDTLMYALLLFTVQFLIVKFFPFVRGYTSWMLFAALIGRFVGIAHPPSADERPLSGGRVLLGWIAVIIFVICFAPNPLDIIQYITPSQEPSAPPTGVAGMF